MRSRLTCFATSEFRVSQDRLIDTAMQCGIDEATAWDETKIRRTEFYRAHGSILNARRGSGYWLWKPYIVALALDAGEDGDIVVYADAGVSFRKPLSPLFELCVANGGLLCFRGHYDGHWGQPSICRVWTKRDCFVLMDCDTAAFHELPMLDASLVVAARSDASRRFVAEWLRYCCDPRILSDQENVCGLPNLEGFVEHRHDQSILTLLAARERIRPFRSPGQFGNHLKPSAFREPGEWTSQPYDEKRVDQRSQYGTLLFHHRKRTLFFSKGKIGPPLPGTWRDGEGARGSANPRRQHPLRSEGTGGGAVPTSGEVLVAMGGLLPRPVRCIQIGSSGSEEDTTSPRRCLEGRVLGGAACTWEAVDSLNEQAAGPLESAGFNMLVSYTSAASGRLLDELTLVVARRIVDLRAFVACWMELDDERGWGAFREIRQKHNRYFGPSPRVSAHFGWVREPMLRGDGYRTMGVVIRVDAPPN